MASITTKFSVRDICYTFDSRAGIIYRSIVHEINITNKSTGDSEVMYTLNNTTPDPQSLSNSNGSTVSAQLSRVPVAQEYEQNLHTEAEVKDLANTWLINKSLSIFQNVGL
jgi:hypothetical protein